MINKVSLYLNNKGLTLVEVLASIILISIILFTFFSFFIQSAKTGESSEEVVDATYLAQGEMEKLYEISRNGDFKDGINEIVNSLEPDDKQLTLDNPYIFKKIISGSYIRIKLTQHTDSQLSNLVIEVFEQDFEQETDPRPRAKMETILEWGS